MEKPMDKKNSKPDLLSRDYLAGALSYVCEMVKQTAKELGLPKNAVYDIALKDAEEADT